MNEKDELMNIVIGLTDEECSALIEKYYETLSQS